MQARQRLWVSAMSEQTDKAGGAGTQTWQAERYANNARFVADLGLPVLDLLAPKRGERILDLGCGDGALTAKLIETGAEVLGVDSAEDLLDAARKLGLSVQAMDGHKLTFDAEFDAVFSNAALHWMLDPDAVVAGVHRALKPGGRFVAEFGGQGNVAAITVALMAVLDARGHDGAKRCPWYFPSPREYAGRLERHGFKVDSIELIPRPTPLPTDMRGWLDTFGDSFFTLLPEAERDAALNDVLSLLAPVLRDEAGGWTADYVRLRVKARRG